MTEMNETANPTPQTAGRDNEVQQLAVDLLKSYGGSNQLVDNAQQVAAQCLQAARVVLGEVVPLGPHED